MLIAHIIKVSGAAAPAHPTPDQEDLGTISHLRRSRGSRARFITKWDCVAGEECAGGAVAAARGAGWARAASPATSRGTRGAAGMGRSGAAPAGMAPRRAGTLAAAAAVPSPRPRGAAAPAAAAPGTPTAPTAPPPALRRAGTPLAETVATAPLESPSLPASSCYYAGPGQTAARVNADSVAPLTSTPSSP